MARSTSDRRLDTRTARLKLPANNNPYYRSIEAGRAVGYRRIAGKAGTWIARRYDPNATPKMAFRALGNADDYSDADGVQTLSFAQAQAKARLWFDELTKAGGRVAKRISVADAIEDYLTDYSARGGKRLAEMETAVQAHIIPKLGSVLAHEITAGAISAWLRGLAIAPPRLRGGKTRANPDQRARRATANRILTILKAALTMAFRDGKVPSDVEWRRVKPFKDVDRAKVQWLEDDEAKLLVQNCRADLRPLVAAALLTGADYSELTNAKVAAVDLQQMTLSVDGKRHARTISLAPEAVKLLRATIGDRSRNELLFVRSDGNSWGKSHQFRPLREACKSAQIIRIAGEPPISFHILRHSYAVRLLRRGVPMQHVSKQLGHKSITITAKHYAHVIPDDVAQSVRELSGDMGLASPAAP